jgi:hypothetical protein
MNAPIRRRRRPILVIILAMLAALAVALPGFANHDDSISGVFESSDGDLVVQHPVEAVDWNAFAFGSHQPDSPEYEAIEDLRDEWNFARFEDATGNPDNIFSGGVKQDDACPGTRTGSMGGGSGKFDLSDIYLSTNTIDGEEFLFLAWVRVPSSPTASSHIGYEFNQGTQKCPNSDLVQRTEGDFLVVYDFEGGDADSSVKLARWLTTADENNSSGDCEVAKALPCWSTPLDLTALGYADAKVNNPADVGTVFDAHRNENLTPVRFGEAGINLTAAGVLDPDECQNFGHVTVASRSSGNSGIAQMKDLVGPHNFQIGNCGQFRIQKVDTASNPLPGAEFSVYLDDGDGTFDDEEDEFIGSCSTTVYTDDEPPVVAPDADQDGIGDCTFLNLHFGEYWIHETVVPDGYTAPTPNPRLVTIDSETLVTITFINAPEPGRILITKTDDASPANPLSGVQFELFNATKPDDTIVKGATTEKTCTTDVLGVCREDGVDGADRPAFDNIEPGFYCASEVASTIPEGHSGAADQCFEVQTTQGGDTITLTFVNPRLHRVIVIVCHEGTNTLHSSNVTLDDGSTEGDTKASLSSPPGGLTEAQLCSLGGATFGGFGHGDQDLTVDIATHSNP